MKRLLSSLPGQLLIALAVAAVGGAVLPQSVVRAVFTISFMIKQLLEFCLPFIVFFFISSGVTAFRQNSVAMIGLLLGSVFVSNSLVSLYAYAIGTTVIGGIAQQGLSGSCMVSTTIAPYFTLPIAPLVRAEHAMLAALFMGVLLTFASLPVFMRLVHAGKRTIEWGLNRLFIPVLPLYVFGFFLKMVVTMPIWQLCGLYGVIFVMCLVLQVSAIMIAYWVAAGGRMHDALRALITASPSYVTALGTMSSIATLPVSVVCAEKNTQNRPLSEFCMPILANVHLLGDSVCVPLFCIATMQAFLGVVPALSTFVIFVGYFCVTMLAVSGIPGGGIIVMLPLLQSLFGFTPEMLSVMTALYLLQDGFGTAANVMGDGALVMVLDRFSKRLGIQSAKTKGA